LRPAYVIDQALKIFSDQVAESEWEKFGIPALFCENAHVESLRNVLAQEVLPKLKLHEFFQVDVEKVLKDFKEHCLVKKNSSENDARDLCIQQDKWYRRFGSTIDLDIAVNMFYSKYDVSESDQVDTSAELLRCKLDALNQEKYLQSLDIIDSILNATMGHVFYERVNMNGPRIAKVEKEHPLTTNYFICDLECNSWEDAEQIAYNDEKGQMIMACNGWVMSNDALKNFAEPDSQVYLRRELVSWGDSIKLVCFFC
jgi:glycogen debranching enzyme